MKTIVLCFLCRSFVHCFYNRTIVLPRTAWLHCPCFCSVEVLTEQNRRLYQTLENSDMELKSVILLKLFYLVLNPGHRAFSLSWFAFYFPKRVELLMEWKWARVNMLLRNDKSRRTRMCIYCRDVIICSNSRILFLKRGSGWKDGEVSWDYHYILHSSVLCIGSIASKAMEMYPDEYVCCFSWKQQ